MVANLNGVVFDQVYGDNSGGAEFDTDGDGTATQEDEFVSIKNTTGSDIDISGHEIWSDAQGSGAPDGPQDGKYHTFPPGTVLAPGETLYVINEITGTPKGWMQEASEGGLESGAGGVNTNFLTEGWALASGDESLALVDPGTGDFIVFNMAAAAETVSSLSGFPGTSNVGEVDAHSVQGDQNAGSSYQYNAGTDSYVYQSVVVPCFAAGTLIETPTGPCPVEDLRVGDPVVTMDHGAQPVRAVLRRTLDFMRGADPRHKPIAFKPGSLGPRAPFRRLVVSPQHRMLMVGPDGAEMLMPAKGLSNQPGVRVMKGRRQVTYVQLVFAQHEIVCAEGAWAESFFPGAYAVSASDMATRRELFDIFPELSRGVRPAPARPILRVRETRTIARACHGSRESAPF